MKKPALALTLVSLAFLPTTGQKKTVKQACGGIWICNSYGCSCTIKRERPINPQEESSLFAKMT